MIHRVHSHRSLASKILLPMLGVFLGVWTVGTLSVGYLKTRGQARDLNRETQNAAFRIAQELQSIQALLTFKAKLVADTESLPDAIAEQDQSELLRLLLPLRSSLELDIVEVTDSQGKRLSTVKSAELSSATLQDSQIIELAQQGLMVTSFAVSENAAPTLVRTLEVESRQANVGAVLVGVTLTTDVLTAMLGTQRQEVVLLQEEQAIAATLPIAQPIQFTPQLSEAAPVSLQIDERAYLAQSVQLPQITDEQFQAIVLTPLAPFRESQRQLWLLVGSFGLVGGFLIALIGLWVARHITASITQLTAATQQLAAGDLTVQMPITGNDEVAALATAFNHMAEQLKHRDRKIKMQVIQLEKMLTELQQMPAQIHTEKMVGLGQMVAGVAHEINNPVSFIYSNVPIANSHLLDLLELLQIYQTSFPKPPSEVEEAAERVDIEFIRQDLPKLLTSMAEGADRIRAIVLSLRTFSRKDEAVWKSVNLHEGLDSTLMMLGHRLKAQSHRPEIEVVKDYSTLPNVSCLARDLNQVFMHLLSNAIDALEASTTVKDSAQIRLQTRLRDNWITIRVQDSGCGISKEIHSQLFNPFFTTKPVGDGMGLGLSISYQIVVEKHGGKLWYDTSYSEGAAFVIELPVQQTRSADRDR